MNGSRPVLLDLFCGAGGAAVGYHRAGFDVIGVDIVPQRHYPFRFYTHDALTFPVDGFDAIHASPPCQGYTTMNNRHGSDAAQLIDAVKERLDGAGVPWVIENVPGATRYMVDPIRLTGEMFGLGVHRPRLFESNVPIYAPARKPRRLNAAAVYGKNDQRRLWTRKDGTELHAADYPTACAAMGIDWMTWDELCQAIPPHYTEHVGGWVIDAIRAGMVTA